MFCPACGSENIDTASHCGICGKELPGAPAAQPTRVPPPNYLVQAILVTIFCCLPFGIIAIVFAAQVNSKFTLGDYAGAVEMSEKAKMWSWISLGVGLIPAGLIVLSICVGIVGGITTSA